MKDVLLVVLPAAFGLAGTFLGAYLTQRAAIDERRGKEDAAARRALADLLHPIRRFSGLFVLGSSGAEQYATPLPDDPSAVVEQLHAAEAALLTAGVPWATIDWGLLNSRSFAESVDAGGGAAADPGARRQLVDAAAEATRDVERFLELLDRPRRRRRSGEAARRMGVPDEARYPLPRAPGRATAASG